MSHHLKSLTYFEHITVLIFEVQNMNKFQSSKNVTKLKANPITLNKEEADSHVKCSQLFFLN
jgi:hypothetical protein